MKLGHIICAMALFICVKGFTQTNPRMTNENYMYTALYDGFDGATLNRNIWDVEKDWKRDNTQNIWVDSPNTVSQNYGKLNLTMLYSPGYTTTNSLITADYISGEVTSDSTFFYGSFECSAKYANQRGSWPAFWAFGGEGIPCEQGGSNACEIDISEYWNETNKNLLGQCYTVTKLENNCHRYYPSICGTKDFDHFYNESMGSSMNDNYHVYKCVWTPDKVDFFMDNVLKNTLFKASFPDKFPYLPLQVKLSQQVTILDCGDVIYPQTSSFDYIKVKQFFLAPEITCPSNICSTGTATMNVDIAATNISWALTPSNLFNGATTGSGTTANITASPFSQGKGKITYTFTVGNYGETFTAEKEVWVGIPPTPVINSNQPLTVYTEQDIVLYDANTDAYPGLLDNFNWTWYCDGVGTYDAYDYGVGGKMYIFHEPGTARIRASVANACSSTNLSSDVFVQVIAQRFHLSISPNPASGETTIEIKSTQKEQANQVIVWELEVYDQMRSMKEEKTKLRTAQTKINTSGWKEGVYIIRALVNGEVVTGKLMVKH